ncbi:unnamed protein product, partial [Polarella glacialis]
MCTTSIAAYRLAGKLCEEYEQRKKEEKELNLKKEVKSSAKSGANGDGVSRQVTEIDYKKHENTVRELDRQEKETEYARKKAEATS